MAMVWSTTRTELIEGLCDFGERVQVGMQNFAVHQWQKHQPVGRSVATLPRAAKPLRLTA